ncbi:hypothetical protein VTJ49DRAFT_2331 [Mycothermus thermophilus]|uniref:Sec20 C-terminal domain-containing protein n=1 Tax=Humicola insolens TaxID=85995 RepID=A0ABR3VQT0_HUMIN
MATFESLHERLSTLQETASQLRELIDRLANLRFEPGSVPLPADGTDSSDNVATELSAEIAQTLRDEEDDLELLREEVADLPPARPGSDAEQRKTRLRDAAATLQADLNRCRTDFRKAQLAARRSLEAAQKRERELLLASYAATASPSPASSTILTRPGDSNGNNSPDPNTTKPPQAQLTPEEARAQLFRRRHRKPSIPDASSSSSPSSSAAVQTSHDVTLALQRTHALIAGEVAKSAFAARTLAESSAALAELQRSYEGVEGLLTRSRELVGALAAREKSDSWYLAAALRILLATLAWLVFRRFLYGPLWWLVWLPVRTGYRVTSGVMVGGGGKGGSSSSVGATMGVVQPGEGASTVVVGVGEEGAVPTVRVGGRERGETGGDAEYPMVEKVGRMVEDTLDRRDADDEKENLTGTEEPEPEPEEEPAEMQKEEEYKPNPKKRMWEEPIGQEAAGGGQEVRDEL